MNALERLLERLNKWAERFARWWENRTPRPEEEKPPVPGPVEPETPAPGYDLTLKVTALTRDQVRFSWSPRAYGWPTKDVGGVVCDAVVELRLADGSGGKFDWIRKGGQAIKGLENVHSGYGGHTLPAPGEKVSFRWVSVDGKRRSNDAEAVWP